MENSSKGDMDKYNMMKEAQDSKTLDWEADHLDLFTKLGVKWPPPSDVSMWREPLVGAVGLSRRMVQTAYFYGTMKTKLDDSYHDLAVTLKAGSTFKGVMPPITPSSVVLDRKNMKIITPQELLGMHGFYVERLYSPEGLSHDSETGRIMDLAASVFNGFSLLAIFFALFTCFELATGTDSDSDDMNRAEEPTAPVTLNGTESVVIEDDDASEEDDVDSQEGFEEVLRRAGLRAGAKG